MGLKRYGGPRAKGSSRSTVPTAHLKATLHICSVKYQKAMPCWGQRMGANKIVPTKANGGLGLIYRLQFAGLRAKNVTGAEASLSERHILSAWAYSLVRRHRNMYHSNTILHTPPRAARAGWGGGDDTDNDL